MLNMAKSRIFVFLFLAFCVLSSKHILIYNEETLVALSFFLFVAFVFRYFGNTIRESLNERGDLIQQELHNFLHLEQHGVQAVLREHQGIAGLVGAVSRLETFTQGQLGHLEAGSQQALRNRVRDHIQARLRTVAASQMMLQQRLQNLLSDAILPAVLYQGATHDSATRARRQHRALEDAIRLVATTVA